MTWTTNKPTQPGWYWYRRKPRKKFDGTRISQCLVYVYEAVGGMFVEFQNGELGKVSIVNGEWSSESVAEPVERDERETQP